MTLHHHIPAAFLAQFSNDKETIPRRKRLLVLGDKYEQEVRVAPASKVAAVNDLYGEKIGTWPPAPLEEVWTGYEGKLIPSIERLVDGSTDAMEWARVLVPFVASLLVRGPDFNWRYERRLRMLGVDSIMDRFNEQNTNGARVIEWNRLLAPVLASHWIVSHCSGDTKLLTNDLGFTRILGAWPSGCGMAVPLTDSCVLVLQPTLERTVLTSKGDSWAPMIEYVPGLVDVSTINLSMARSAQRFIYGAAKDHVRDVLERTIVTHHPPEPGDLGFMSLGYMRAHEHTWHRLLCAIESPPDELAARIPFDPKLFANAWAPPINLSMGSHRFPSALHRVGDDVVVRFYDPEGNAP